MDKQVQPSFFFFPFYLWLLGNFFLKISQTSYYVLKPGSQFNIAYKHDVEKGKNGWEVKGN